MTKVSIIVPVYNAEDYLDKCIESIVKQTLEDIEIILIDDGSTDASPKICDLWAKNDSRILVYHIKNSGVCAARNFGIEVACGDYVGFVDSDDYIAENMYETMYFTALQNSTDVVICDHYRVRSESIMEECTIDLKNGFYNKEQIIEDIYPRLIASEYVQFGIINAQWDCVIRRDLLIKHNIRYDVDIKYAEDTLFAAILLYNTNTLYYLKNEHLYYYRFHQDSRSQRYKPDAWQNYLILCNRFKEKFSNLDYDFSKQFPILVIYWACIALREINFYEGNLFQKYILRKKIICSVKLKDAFRNFSMPSVCKDFVWKRKAVLLALKYRFVIIYGVFAYKMQRSRRKKYYGT